MRKVLHLKHWQVFILLSLSLLVGKTTIEGYPAIKVSLDLLGTILFFSILIIYGHYLYTYLPKNIELNYKLFIVNSLFVLSAAVALDIFPEANLLNFTNIYALPSLYFCYALLHTIAFPLKVLTSIELKSEAGFFDYIGLVFMLLFWPFGIWFIQPRVNRVAKQEPIRFGD